MSEKVHLTVRIPKRLALRIDDYANHLGKPRSEVLIDVIDRGLYELAAHYEFIKVLEETIALIDLPFEWESPDLSDIRELDGGLGLDLNGDD
ncbi:MAG: hypothetical protein ACKOX2_17035 [Microcystaceae cyanobacterium]